MVISNKSQDEANTLPTPGGERGKIAIVSGPSLVIKMQQVQFETSMKNMYYNGIKAELVTHFVFILP